MMSLSQANFVSVRTACSICGGNPEPVLDLGEVGLPYFTDTIREDVPSAPLTADYCHECFALQLRHVVDRNLLFTKYWYRSNTNTTMRNHLITLAQEVTLRADIQPDSVILDIGSNDGTFLAAFPRGQRIGFEPSDAGLEAPLGQTVIRQFFSASAFGRTFPGKKAQAIASLAMFYDLEEPRQFAQEVAEVLADKGVWCLEMNYLNEMLRQNAFDFIVHEHITLYFLATLNRVLRPAGLEVFDVSTNDINGGSLRAWIGHSRAGRATSGNVDRLLWRESAQREPEAVKAFGQRSQQVMTTLKLWLGQAKAQGKSVMGYGASTRGGTMLAALGADVTLIAAIADRNPDKVGKFMGRTRIPIISEDAFRQAKPDYLVILPWSFLPEFQERERVYLAAGGKMILALPEARVIG